MTSSDDCFILAKIHCLHRGQVLKKQTKKKIEERLCLSFQTISGLNLVCNFAFYDQILADIRQEFGLRPLIFSAIPVTILFHDYNTIM
jgi:hypothetical protein